MLYPNVVLTQYQKKGYGIYTTQFIPKGSVIWVPCKNCLTYPAKYFENMSKRDIAYIEDKAYYKKDGNLLMPCGISRFMNHSCNANTLEYGLDFGIAVRDILPDEEICSDYRRWLNDKPWEMECYCHSETCIGKVSPQMGFDAKLQQFWECRVRDALALLTKVNQPLHDICMDCSNIYSRLCADMSCYLQDDSISIRNPKYSVFLHSKSAYDSNIEAEVMCCQELVDVAT